MINNGIAITSKEEPYKRKTIERKSHEFPYPLTCSTKPRHNPKNPKRFNVAITYHVGMVKNWKTILHDQMYTLHQCGLGDLVDKFILSYSNGKVEEILYELQNYSFATKPDIIVESVKAPWEGAAMNAMREFCLTTTTNTGTMKQQQKQQEQQKPTVVFYFHNKGASRYNSDWKNPSLIEDGKSYAHCLYWRKYMEFYLLERPETCLHRILKGGARTCGTMLRTEYTPMHYSGNFWAASCDHVGELDLMAEGGNYYAAEFWVNSKGIKLEWVCLDNARLRIPGKDPYFHLVLPELYWNRTENLLTTGEMEELFF